MSKKKIKGKIETVIENPGIAIENSTKKGWGAVKNIGKNEKIKEVVESPGIAIEKGIKKGWNIAMAFGKELKKRIAKETKEKKKSKKKKIKS